MSVTLQSTRFGEVEIPDEAVIDFPLGLIGLGGSRYTLLARSDDAAFVWLHSLDDPALALPLTNPWRFFDSYEVEIADDRHPRHQEPLPRQANEGLGHRPHGARARQEQRQPGEPDLRVGIARHEACNERVGKAAVRRDRIDLRLATLHRPRLNPLSAPLP